MNKEEIKQYYERLEKLLNGANKETYGFVPEEIRQILKCYEILQQENKQLKQMVNFGGITITNCPNCEKEITINFCRETEQYRQKYLKFKDNWNKLKEYISETKINEFEKAYGKRYGKVYTQAEIIVFNMILSKMEELEKGVSNE